MNLLHFYIIPLILTIISEFIVYLIIIKKNPFNLFLYSVLINSFTLPLANYVFINILQNFLIIELFVFLSEIILLYLLINLSYKKATFLSFAANSVSAVLGFIIFL